MDRRCTAAARNLQTAPSSNTQRHADNNENARIDIEYIVYVYIYIIGIIHYILT